MGKIKKAAALRYEAGQQDAPTVIASGRGEIAEKIINIAKENDIPTFENGWAADILCNIPLDSEIPDVLYQTIAEIYAFILDIENTQKSTPNK